MKIQKIEVSNFKAVKEESMNFDGCSAIITAGNNKGKTSILRGLIDRFRGEKPELIVSEGEEKGFNRMYLTDGSVIEWKFTEKTENFSFTTPDGIVMKTGVLSSIGKMYFGVKFDIDKFLNKSSAEQMKEAQLLVGLDFSDINKRYKEAYDTRTDINRELKTQIAKEMVKPGKVDVPDLSELNKKLELAKADNLKIKAEWKILNDAHQSKILAFNEEQNLRKADIQEAKTSMTTLESLREGIFLECIDFAMAKRIQESLPAVEEMKILTSLEEPQLVPEQEIQDEINAMSEKLVEFNNYERNLKEYQNWVTNITQLESDKEKYNAIIQDIQEEKSEMIKSAKIPKDFEFSEDGLLYKGLPLTDSQISSSAKYISALKLGSLVLGKIRTMHFDASYLDKNSLAEIQVWADQNNLQLLIEKPAWEGGDIKYEIICKD